MLKSLVLYMVHLLLAAIALLMSTQLTVDTPTHPSSTACDVLQAVLVLSNTGMLYSEFRQLGLGVDFYGIGSTPQLQRRMLVRCVPPGRPDIYPIMNVKPPVNSR